MPPKPANNSSSKPVGRFNRPKLAQKVRSLTLSSPEDLARMTKSLASALNKTGAFAKTSITPSNPSPSGGSASDLLAMTSRLKELMDPANPNCLPPPPVKGKNGAPVPSDDDMLNVAQMLYALAPRSSDGNSMSYLNHGCECHAAGDYEQAIELYVKALNVRLQFFGANSLPVGQVYSLVAHTLHAAGELEDAEDYYSRSLEIRADMLRSLEQKGLGGDFLPLATAQQALEYNNSLPQIPRGPGGSQTDSVAQEVVAAAAASVNNDMPGEMYPDTPASARLLELIHDDMYCEQYTGPMSPERRTLLENACEAQRSAVRLTQEGKMDLAIARYHQVRELAAQLLGPRCLDVAQSYSDIGCAYNAMGQHDRALEFHSKALVIQGENLGPRNKYLASTYNCMGHAMAHREDVAQAFAHYIFALDIRLDEFPNFSGSSDVACSLDNIGSMLKLEGELERSHAYFVQSLEVQIETLGLNHLQQATTFVNIADAYQKQYKIDASLEFFVRASSFRMQNHGPFHATMSETLSALASVYENKGDLDAAINCFLRSVDIEIVQAGCIPDNTADLLSKLDVLGMDGSLSGFDLVGCYITLAKLFVLKKNWQSASDFTIASLTLSFYRQNLNPDLLKADTFDHPEQPFHPDLLRFLSDHSCLVHVFVLTDRTAEMLPYLPMLERIVNLNMLQMHHADAIPPIVVFHVAASEVYRAANMPTRSAASMKNALDLLQVDPGIQRRLAHAPTSHTGNLSFDPRVMARLMQSQTVLAARMKQRDEKESRVTDPLPYRPPRVPLPVPEFELPSYGAGSLPKPDLSVLCLDIMRTLKKHGLGDKETMGRWAARAKALKASVAAGARVNIGPSPALTLPMLDKLTFAHDSSGGAKGGR